MVKLGILASIVIVLSALGVIRNAQLLAEVDQIAQGIALMNVFEPTIAESDHSEWRRAAKRDAILGLVIYSFGVSCGLGLLWKQRWARAGTLSLALLMLAMAMLSVVSAPISVFLVQMAVALLLSISAWWVLTRTEAADLFGPPWSAKPVRRRRAAAAR
jgi:hypothetical protein